MMNNQQGIGLPEILIALLLASLTMMALVRHYLNTKQHYRYLQTKLERNIDLQLVTDLIRDVSRRAGFTPCLSIDHLMTIDQRNSHKRLVAIEINQNRAHAMKINRMSEHFNIVTQVIGQSELLITNNKALHRDQSVLIADCYHAEVQKIKQIKHAPNEQVITLTQPLAFSYYPPIYVGAWLEETYSIRTDHYQNGALFYHFQHFEELTPAVHTLAVHIEKHRGRSLLQVILGLEKEQRLELSTMVRMR